MTKTGLCNRLIDKRRREFISYDKTGINYQDVFGIARSEESYTQFMEWLLDHEGSHGLRNKPLNLFLKKMKSNVTVRDYAACICQI